MSSSTTLCFPLPILVPKVRCWGRGSPDRQVGQSFYTSHPPEKSVRQGWVNDCWLIRSDGMPAAPQPCRQRLVDSDFPDSCMQASLCNCDLGQGMLWGRQASQGLCRHLSHGPAHAMGCRRKMGSPGDAQNLWAHFFLQKKSNNGKQLWGGWALAWPPSSAATVSELVGMARKHGKSKENNKVLHKWLLVSQKMLGRGSPSLPNLKHSSLNAKRSNIHV